MILGAVLAGGQSRRFGSDKALAEWNGQTLLARSVDQLSVWCDHVVVTGRAEAPAPCLPDWPRANMGPLAGIAAALHFAADEGYEAVLTCGVDAPDLPDDLLKYLSPAPACCEQQPVIGLWPVATIATLETILRGSGRYSLFAFAEAVRARRIIFPANVANINTPADLVQAVRINDISAE